jgi:arylsulfatase A-like enzyme
VAVNGWVRRSWQRWLNENHLWKSAVQGYLASISFADAQVGRLMAALDHSAHAHNTIIVLWSDHGMHIGEKEHWEKFTLWEESTRVPLMIVAPGVTQPARVCTRPVSLVDVFPTLVELAGQSPMAQLDGISLVPWLRNPTAPKQQPALTTWGRNNHSVRTERWRYTRYHNGDEELYDHQTDPDEFTNLGARPEHNLLKQALARWMPRTSAKPADN